MKYGRVCGMGLILLCGIATGCSESKTEEGAIKTPSSPVADSDNGRHKYGGVVDSINCDTIGGWVLDSENPAAVNKVNVFVDNVTIGTVSADIPRPDMKNGNVIPNFGYAIPIPAKLKDGKPHTVSAKVEDGTYEFKVWEKIPGTFTCSPR